MTGARSLAQRWGKHMDAIDADQDVTAYLTSLKQAGCSVVGRYYSKHAWKVMGALEAKSISSAGLKIFAVYEDSDDPSTFGSQAGTEHANRALDYATSKIHQPNGSAIYFAADFDVSPHQAQTSIKDYFVAVGAAFAQRGSPYRVGVYSNGIACAYLLDSGLASLAWLSQSTGYQGHATFYASKRWALAQNMKPVGIPHLDGDVDELSATHPDFGGFQLPAD